MNKVEEKLRRKHGGFMIGDLVVVSEFYKRKKDHGKGRADYNRSRYPSPYSEAQPRAGWIVGFTSLRPGRVEYMGFDEGYSYTATGSLPAVLVRFWPHLRPVPVPFDGFREWRDGDPEPYPPNGSRKEIEEARRCYEKFKEDYPRDERGRFTA